VGTPSTIGSGRRNLRGPVEAQTNEVLAKVVAHNLCCLIQAFYELGIDPVFNEVDVDAVAC
jgi:hypothetical protein